MRALSYANAALMATLVGCVANPNIQRGDAAAARGAWRDAEIAYRKAVREQPNDIGIAKKYATAKSHALDEALRVVAACRAANDDNCVERELDYVLLVDPTNVAAARERTVAKQSHAAKLITEARQALDNAQPIETWRLITEARALGTSDDAALALPKLEADSVLVAQDITINLLRAATGADSATAIELLNQATTLADGIAERSADKSLQTQVATQRQRVVTAEVVRLNQEEAVALAAADYTKAGIASSQIARLAPTKAHLADAMWCLRVADAHQALARRNFPEAVQLAKQALATGADTGVAQLIVDQAEARVYTVRLGAIAITPVNPQTMQPWVGKPWWHGAVGDLAGAASDIAKTAFKLSGGDPRTIAADMAAKTVQRYANAPVENRPTLYVEVTLPDKRRFATTQNQKGLLVSFGAVFSLLTNKLDRRNVIFTIRQKRDSGDPLVAEIAVPLGALVDNPANVAISPTPEMAALLAMEIQVAAAAPEDDGAVEKMRPLNLAENQAPTRSTASRGATRIRLERAKALLPNEESDFMGSPPDPFLRLTQNGVLVVQTPTHANDRNSEWTFATTDLFVSNSDQFVLTLLDDNDTSNTTLASWPITGAEILSQAIVVREKPNGTKAALAIGEWGGAPE